MEFLLSILLCFVSAGLSFPEIREPQMEQLSSIYSPPKQQFAQSRQFVPNAVKNGTKFHFTSLYDGSVITVQPNGDVICENLTNKPEQEWTVVIHFRDPNFYEFKQAVVPYNMLSGYEDSFINPGIFPRPLGFADPYRSGLWQIIIRGRWCLESNGRGWPLEMDDCEYFYAPWQLWAMDEVTD